MAEEDTNSSTTIVAPLCYAVKKRRLSTTEFFVHSSAYTDEPIEKKKIHQGSFIATVAGNFTTNAFTIRNWSLCVCMAIA